MDKQQLKILNQSIRDSLTYVKTAIEKQELTNAEKIEFFNVYEEEIINMLENKISEVQDGN